MSSTWLVIKIISILCIKKIMDPKGCITIFLCESFKIFLHNWNIYIVHPQHSCLKWNLLFCTVSVVTSVIYNCCLIINIIGIFSIAISPKGDSSNLVNFKHSSKVSNMSAAEILTRALWRAADAVCFDVDSTVCQDEAIDELAKFAGKEKEVTEL